MNKKIQNATPKIVNGIKFKSLQEVMVYKTLLQEGFNPNYEEFVIHIWEGTHFKTPFYNKYYNRAEKTQVWGLNNTKVIDITYTPDFTFIYNNVHIFIEVKGFENDCYYLKEKLFREWLDKQDYQSVFFKINTKKQLLEAIKIIKNY